MAESSNGAPLVVSFGEMLIDFVPDVSGVSLAESSGFIKAPGGAPANVAVAITKLGGRSAFIGKFGDDEFGHMLVDILKQNKVEDEGVLFDTHARTALVRDPSSRWRAGVHVLPQPKCRHVANGEGAKRGPHPPCLHLPLWLHQPYLGALPPAHLAAMRAAKEAGILLSYDPNVRLPLWPSEDAAREGIKSIWKEADFIKVSDDEVSFLTKGDPHDENNVLSLWYDGLKLLVVTDGEKGCRYFTKGFKGQVNGYSVNTVDTTGAGDAFVGSFLVSIAKDRSIFEDEAKLRKLWPSRMLVVPSAPPRRGAIPAFPTAAMAQELMAKGNQ
ncbi:hypothetical protein HPP92_002033 [Vanilla planifolia]|uniref:Carbohydrate kinase PfkB domain-containing protein n=1 Tax=Vanilla planifolia TaxID=51239 RepID=A0A835S5F0_VANPL|nr:hypothetical protein HPP92_002033 [Vanilla planifolia]